ncbi:MAG: hypothetical protein KKD44_26940 [Proteobacteria bacterium]|nr:hypothetical protein [Pseudomonadota bacterium]
MKSGFRRWEARELALLPTDDGALNAMIDQRSRMANRVFNRARKDGLTDRQAQYRLTNAIKDYYLNKVKVKTAKMEKTVKGKRATWKVIATDRAGFPHQWRKKLINISRIHGDKRRKKEADGVDIPIDYGEFEETPGEKGEGDRRMQKARRRAAVRDAKSVGKLRVDLLEKEYKNSFKLVAESKMLDQKRNQLERQRDLKRRLETAQAKGAKYG